MKIGDIDVGSQLLDNEYRIILLEKFLQFILDNNQDKLVMPDSLQYENMKKNAVEDLNKKYPTLGLKYKENNK